MPVLAHSLNALMHPDSTLAQFARHGITYDNDSTFAPSDSFPGLAASTST